MGWLITAIIVVLLICAFRLARLATRLDRLHRRTEAAWAALDVALARRSGVARAVAVASGLDIDIAASIAKAARRTDAASRAQRADAENELTKALETMPTAPESSVANELLEASQRILLARRFYNDAVRDTRALRADRFSRMFRLAGSATLPDYFEIAEYSPARPLTRVSARIVLLDEHGRALLLGGSDPHRPGDQFWFTPGGGVELGEDLISAAQRELAEETGLVLRGSELTGPLWWRRSRFSFTGVEYEQTEYFFAAGLPATATALSTGGLTDVEKGYVTGYRWWGVDELRDTSEVVYPLELAIRLPEALAALRDGWDPIDPVKID